MSTTTAPRRENSVERRRAIAAAARALIVEKGVEGLRTRDIAERVGINVATLHYHVPTKEALIGLVAETMREEFRNQSLLRPRAHLSPAEQLEHEFYDVHEMYFERPDVIAVMSELMERGRRDPIVRDAIRPILSRWREMVAEILAAGVADGTFRSDLDPVAGAHIFVGSMISFWRGSDGSPQFFERLCDEVRRAFRERVAT